FFSRRNVQADEIAADAEGVKPVAIDRGSATRPLAITDAAIGLGDAATPTLAAGRFVECPDDFIVAAKAHAENTTGRDRRVAVATAQAFRRPGKTRPAGRQSLQKTGLLRDGRPIGALPLRPIERLRPEFGPFRATGARKDQEKPRHDDLIAHQ